MPITPLRRPRLSAVVLVATAAFVLTACPNDEEASPPVEEPPGEDGITPEDDNDDNDDGNDDGDGDDVDDDAVSLELVAEGNSFDEDTLTVPAGAQVVLELDNRDNVGHNFALYESEAAEDVIFQGEVVTEPTTYEFTAPDEPGTYHFQCDPHADLMNGEFLVEEP